MQDHDWDDFKYLLALHRTGTLSQAAGRCGVSETTVARRLQRLQQALGVTLFFRDSAGRHQLAEAAQHILDHAEIMERQNMALRETLQRTACHIAGTVRISAVPVIINHVLLPQLGKLSVKHPHLNVELVPEARNVDLTKREADLAIRFSRPEQGGLATKAQKLGELSFGVFCGSQLTAEQRDGADWICYDETSASLPQARWTEEYRKRLKQRASSLRVSDIDTAMEATGLGYGKAILPNLVCEADTRFLSIDTGWSKSGMTRDVWLLSHSDEARLSIATVKIWLAELPWS
ncbi:LysR family transcriptional regulator [Ruegeria sp. Ofav3-42]|nr:LysR family transcriptional regulator [Ruegeria sp. Ofav3-42]